MSSDHFSPLAGQYASFRPDYPDELFDWLASIAPQPRQAWDCGAGSGQASVALSTRFEKILATDISAAQLASAPALHNIEYRLASAENSGLPDRSVDLITVAQALHWFDLASFYTEAHRVLKPHGVIAVWGYNHLQIGHAGLQEILDEFYDRTIGAYWPPERVHVESNYRDLPFPFSRIATPAFALHKEWSREHLLGYLRSWSAVGRFQAARGFDPVSTIIEDIGKYWPESETRQIQWPLFVHAGRKE